MQDNARISLITPVSLFASNGFLVGSWATAIPGLAARLDLNESHLSIVLLSFAIGGIAMMLASPRLIRRIGAGKLAIISGLGFAATFTAPINAPSWGLAIVCAAIFGITHGTMDVAMNAATVEMERQRPKPILSTMHGCFSVGATAGAICSGALLEAQLSPALFSCAVAAIAAVILLPALPAFRLLPTQVANPSGAHAPRRIPGVLLILAFVAFACLVAEGGMIDWLAKLINGFGASEFHAGAVYGCFAAGMATGRFAGDHVRTRLGDTRIVAGGCLLACAGLGLTLLSGSTLLALPAMLAAGLGIANVIPILFRASAAVGADPSSSLAFVTACGYAGMLTGPPLIGFVAHASHLRYALVIVAAGLVLASIAAPFGLRSGASTDTQGVGPS